jgi:hypothetical protein
MSTEHEYQVAVKGTAFSIKMHDGWVVNYTRLLIKTDGWRRWLYAKPYRGRYWRNIGLVMDEGANTIEETAYGAVVNGVALKRMY